MDSKKVGLVVKEIRKEKGYTQKQLAEKVDCSRSYIADIERGAYNASMDTLDSVANALGVNLSYLILRAEKEINDDFEVALLKIKNEFPQGLTLLKKATDELNDNQMKKLADFMEFYLSQSGENKEG